MISFCPESSPTFFKKIIITSHAILENEKKVGLTFSLRFSLFAKKGWFSVNSSILMTPRVLQKQTLACMITQLKRNFRLSGVQQSSACRIFSCECSEIIHLVNSNIALTTTQSICTNKSLPQNKSNTKS